jgi:hypothetical protein
MGQTREMRMTRPDSRALRATHLLYGATDDQVDRLHPVRAARPRRTGPTPEGVVLHECLAYLKHRTRWCHRLNSGVVQEPRYHRYGFLGQPDIMGQLHDGRILFVECKSATGRMTPDQQRFFESVQSDHVVAILARSVADLAVLDS